MLRSKSKYANIDLRQYINLDLLNLVRVMCVHPVGPLLGYSCVPGYTPFLSLVSNILTVYLAARKSIHGARTARPRGFP